MKRGPEFLHSEKSEKNDTYKDQKFFKRFKRTLTNEITQQALNVGQETNNEHATSQEYIVTHKQAEPELSDDLKFQTLLTAVAMGDPEIITNTFLLGIDINMTNHGCTALDYAIYRNNLDGVNALIAAGADVNKKNDHGMTPLLYAITQGHIDIIETLVFSAADIDGLTKDGCTPAVLAMQCHSNKPLLKKIIDLIVARRLLDTAFQIRKDEVGENDMIYSPMISLQDLQKNEYDFIKEVHDKKMLGHSLGLTGQFRCYHKTLGKFFAVDYEASSIYATFPVLSDLVTMFNQCLQENNTDSVTNKLYSENEKEMWQMVVDAFQAMLSDISSDDIYHKQAELYLKGRPIIIFQNLVYTNVGAHYFTIVMHKNRMYFVDRRRQTIAPFKFNPDMLPQDPNKLAAWLHTMSTTEYKITLHNDDFATYNPYLSTLEMTAENHYQRKLQKQGNCAYSELRSACEGILIALETDADEITIRELQGKSLTSEEVKISNFWRIDTRNMYKAFSGFDRIKNIDKYVSEIGKTPRTDPWEPLYKYIREKRKAKNPRSEVVSDYIMRVSGC